MRFSYSVAPVFSLVFACGRVLAQAQNYEPAMIGQGPQSVASKLHYPDKAKAAKTEAATQFYCEVNDRGQARRVMVLSEKQNRPFRDAVEKALNQGQFSPAQVGGKATPVMIGGTVLFLSANGQPTIVISLTTADKNKAVAGGNYIQPQMLSSFANFEKKLYNWRSLVKPLGSARPSAEVLLNVDQNGNVTSTKILGETNPGGGLGAVVLKACEGTKFVPAHASGKAVAGQFNLPVDFTTVMNPDQLDSGSHLKPREY
jgi:TonB family protein